ncbi:acyl carrier protein [Cellulomonas sp. S1-8]|uniref:acyl carrier protein n=1 Tax=Cellulomonas sp. S1-8 TaxID=2904790 RepID=UPI002244A867|nr:acyl carrier protein [Cellulomonas sp. S1-8]UZN03410.1 acyl carrier protein [Cellulomonas sp. S1-8]
MTPTTTPTSRASSAGTTKERLVSDTQDVRAAVVGVLEALLIEDGVEHPELTDDVDLSDVGLDSLGFAVLITRLEDELDRNPFVTIEGVEAPRTVGSLVALYQPGHAPA